MDDILGLTSPPTENHTKRIKALVQETWDLPDDVVVMVSELKCHEDGCPDLETVIAVMSGNAETKKVKISSAMADIDAPTLQAVQSDLH